MAGSLRVQVACTQPSQLSSLFYLLTKKKLGRLGTRLGLKHTHTHTPTHPPHTHTPPPHTPHPSTHTHTHISTPLHHPHTHTHPSTHTHTHSHRDVRKNITELSHEMSQIAANTDQDKAQQQRLDKLSEIMQEKQQELQRLNKEK